MNDVFDIVCLEHVDCLLQIVEIVMGIRKNSYNQIPPAEGTACLLCLFPNGK